MAALFLLLPQRAPAQAQSDWTEVTTVVAEPADKPVLWREVWAGVDVAADGWLGFTGLTVAPFGHIHQEGLRLRIASGAGRYHYSGVRGVVLSDPATGRRIPRGELQTFAADTGFAEVLVGYLWRLDPLIVKLLAGAEGVSHDIAPFDEENLAIGLDWGPKVKAELWLNIGQAAWGSLDASWSAAHEAIALRGRLGYRLAPKTSVGLEGRIDFDAQGRCDLHWQESEDCAQQYAFDSEPAAELWDYSRAGAFVRFAWEGGEVSLASGVAGASLDEADIENADPYATLSWIMQY